MASEYVLVIEEDVPRMIEFLELIKSTDFEVSVLVKENGKV